MWCSLHLRRLCVLLTLTTIQAKDPELPLCPTNMQYFPQNLPMHCRMPGTIPPFLPQIYQNSMLGKQPEGIPNPLPGLAGPLPGPLAGPIPGPMPMPMMPMPQAPAHKLPVIVMPFYSPEPSAKKTHSPHPIRPAKKRKLPHKKRRPKYYYNSEDDSDADTSTDDSTEASSERGWWRGSKQSRRSSHHHKSRKNYENKEVLTPILQYVTKDGYVIFEKQISRGEAKDWLVTKHDDKNKLDTTTVRNEEFESNERRNERGEKKFLIKDVEEIEVRTEKNPHQMSKKRNLKRKSIKQKVED